MMNDSFFEFADDDTTAGFRCHTLELYNWGTFNGRIFSLPLRGKNGLLTGDIGSGKSTIVDAVTTLLVPSQKISYNKAAGATFKERSLRSYVMGYYKSERSDSGYSTKPVALRDAGSTHSVILGHFCNEDFAQDVTLAQVFYQKDMNGQPQRFYIVADRVLSISEHFSDFGNDLAHLRKRLREMERVEMFDSFPEYGASFQRRFGLRNKQAMELFNQTVSLKTVGNLTSFVQEHMLEPFDSATQIENLIHHFEDLNRSHETILKAKEQVSKLTPLMDNLDKYHNTEREIFKRTRQRDALGTFFAQIRSDLLSTRIEKERMNEAKLIQQRDSFQRILDEMHMDRDALRQDITKNGGDRIAALKIEIERTEGERREKQRRYDRYEKSSTALSLPLPTDIGEFEENRNASKRQIEIFTKKRSEIENHLKELDFSSRTLKDDYRQVDDEVLSLKNRKTNIDTQQINLRSKLCKDLSLPEEKLPFAGELIAVNENQKEWEGAVERILRPFSLSLLVPDEYYRAVSEWVDSTNLKGRIVYYRITLNGQHNTESVDHNSVYHKLIFKEESVYTTWVKQQVRSRYSDVICCANLNEFRRVKRGLTRRGQIKGNIMHHEKDDRYAIDDRSRYVLGWSNTAKIAVLEKKRQEIELKLQKASRQTLHYQNTRNEHEKTLDHLKALQGFELFEEVDWKPAVVRIEKMKEEIAFLESKSDILHNLQEKLKTLNEQIITTQNELDCHHTNLGSVRTKIEHDEQAREAELEVLSTAQFPLQEIESLISPLLPSYLFGVTLSLKNCDPSERRIREKLQQEIDTAKKRIDRLRDTIITKMGDFRRDYPGETRDMDDTIESGREYRQLLESLVKENLPRFEQQFKLLLNENTIREIASFSANLSKESQKIRERITLINQSLHEVDYNPGRYIFLEAMPTSDIEIRNFRQELKSCVEGSVSGEASDQYSEAKFLQVKELVNRFKGREGYADMDKKWTAKVTDVRSWFVFAASERWKEDDSEYEHYTDSGGKSGGQKEKLAYTVLAASLAYQFGLEWGEVRSRSFRFVVIDEAFGRGSDESAKYGLDLFKRLNLQLLIVTPLQKIHIIEPYVSSVGFVHNPEGKNSLLRNLTIEEYRKEKKKHLTIEASE
jgi:uncharacterized protein YPO0396